jgi:hypothetical protein
MVQQSLPQREPSTKVHRHQNQHPQQEELQHQTNSSKTPNQTGAETSIQEEG